MGALSATVSDSQLLQMAQPSGVCVCVCVCVSDVISRSILYAYRAKQTIKAFVERQLFLDAINLLHLQITVDYSRSFKNDHFTVT